MDLRQKVYYDLKTHLTYLSDKNVVDLLKKAFLTDSNVSKGWGNNIVITVNDHKVFTKSIPVTDIEHNNQFDSSNLYNLPLYYNYGVGSAGVNCNRELLMHVKTTNWVLDGTIDNFPLLYHWRIVDSTMVDSLNNNEKEVLDMSTNPDFAKYVTRWNSNKQIEKYMIDRSTAKYKLILFLEYIPTTLYSWLNDDISKIDVYSTQMTKLLTFLRHHDIYHMDGHVGNILTDGKTMYLTDFGMCQDLEFTNSSEEVKFIKDHENYDFCHMYSNIHQYLTEKMREDKNADYFLKKYGIDWSRIKIEDIHTIYKNLRDISEYLGLSKEYVDYLERTKEQHLIYSNFLMTLRRNPKKDTPYPKTEIDQLLSKLM
ncbi:hypothetical protein YASMINEVIRUS_739 [Yasminevirus sp. GU-2018]|uniref:Protein kinase domain-containing protein n=1 Tax=Yasminevirus sp. GU-2018 TaxID=2420051 RepID=A0A5K0UB31_9VIRU|nr:hypothetical protein YASMINEVIRUS_739 [Yasminevirus sp. GU-2018]